MRPWAFCRASQIVEVLCCRCCCQLSGLTWRACRCRLTPSEGCRTQRGPSMAQHVKSDLLSPLAAVLHAQQPMELPLQAPVGLLHHQIIIFNACNHQEMPYRPLLLILWAFACIKTIASRMLHGCIPSLAFVCLFLTITNHLDQVSEKTICNSSPPRQGSSTGGIKPCSPLHVCKPPHALQVSS